MNPHCWPRMHPCLTIIVMISCCGIGALTVLYSTIRSGNRKVYCTVLYFLRQCTLQYNSVYSTVPVGATGQSSNEPANASFTNEQVRRLNTSTIMYSTAQDSSLSTLIYYLIHCIDKGSVAKIEVSFSIECHRICSCLALL